MAGNKVRVGSVEITSLSDGILEFDLCNFFPNHKSDEEWRFYRQHLVEGHKGPLQPGLLPDSFRGPHHSGGYRYGRPACRRSRNSLGGADERLPDPWPPHRRGGHGGHDPPASGPRGLESGASAGKRRQLRSYFPPRSLLAEFQRLGSLPRPGGYAHPLLRCCHHCLAAAGPGAGRVHGQRMHLDQRGDCLPHAGAHPGPHEHHGELPGESGPSSSATPSTTRPRSMRPIGNPWPIWTQNRPGLPVSV